MAKYEYDDANILRKALIDFISEDVKSSEDERQNIQYNNKRAILNDVTGSLGVWGIGK